MAATVYDSIAGSNFSVSPDFVAPGATASAPPQIERGDTVTLAGSDRVLETIVFPFRNRGASATADLSVTFYNVGTDGLPLPFGSVFASVDFDQELFTGRSNGSSFFKTLDFTSEGIVLPDTFAVTFNITNRTDVPTDPSDDGTFGTAGDGVAEDFDTFWGDVVLGASTDGYLVRESSTVFDTVDPGFSTTEANFRMRITAIPEPMSVTFGAAMLGLVTMRRRR
ncbi:MAG: hypothetical protein AAF743_03900 [Planctomycetota bacterium]